MEGRSARRSRGRFRTRGRHVLRASALRLLEADARLDRRREPDPEEGRRAEGEAELGRRSPSTGRSDATFFIERGEATPREDRLMAATRRERKVVTVVFCDLVGFTSARGVDGSRRTSRRCSRPYHERLRAELERHGGTVEKFIGDAVMALFGAPTAHEDDAERAVRACARDSRLRRRGRGSSCGSAMTTGEALIRLDARPEAGEGMASGDVVNTAARLQNAAPVNGDPRRRDDLPRDASSHRLRGGERGRGEGQGRADPASGGARQRLRASASTSRTRRARSSSGASASSTSSATRSSAPATSGTPQLVTLVGVPGIGKSRLVYELSRIVDADPELITWRQGRCLAYGDGVTLWALGEIVKAQAGVLEQDTPRRSRRRSDQAVEDTLAEPGDEARVETHLLALVGLAGESAARRGSPERGIRRLAPLPRGARRAATARRSSFEDIHWADESLLDFVDELVDWVTDVPLLVVATARPELLERRPGWGGGKLNATTLALSPLSDEQTAAAARAAARHGLCSPPSRSRRCSSARAATRSTRSSSSSSTLEQGSTDELPLPETLQGIIAARLDGARRSRRRACSRTPPSSARCSGRARSAASRCRRRLAPLARAQGLRPPSATLVARGRERVRVRARARS